MFSNLSETFEKVFFPYSLILQQKAKQNDPCLVLAQL
jgi:hypothetical protein